MKEELALELKHVSKRFGNKVANHDVSFTLRKGEILALLGENGSGKTSIMNVVAGIYFPDEGEVFINGQKANIKSPIDAYRYKVGMIHQHFKLIDSFTAADNIILGTRKPKFSYKEAFAKLVEKRKNRIEHVGKGIRGLFWTIGFNILFGLRVVTLPIAHYVHFDGLGKERNRALTSIVNKYGFDIDLNKKVTHMSVSEKQTVEILKVLYRGAEILILDEPTAVLTPQETKKLFSILKTMKKDGKSIIIITHKLNEVLEISDRVTILRKGEYIETLNTKDTNEKELTNHMVGKKIDLKINRSEPKNLVKRLSIQKLNIVNKDGDPVVRDFSFDAFGGEILGIAGIAGSGQRELLESISGLRKKRITGGDIYYYDPEKNNETVDIRSLTANEIRELGIRLSFVPEDRLGMGLIGNMNLIDNTMLRSYRKGRGVFLDRKTNKVLVEQIIEDLGVDTPSPYTEVKKLSGGNVQKILVGRELSSGPKVLMAAYPVRGLDINSSYLIYNLLNRQKENGTAVIFVGEDLDVLLALSDRIVVMSHGRVAGIVDARTTTKEKVGLLMLKDFKEDK